MSKEFSVASAVAGQLHQEGRWPPNDLNKIMGTNYHYDINTISLFLAKVQWNLKHGTESYDFEFDAAFANTALGWPVGVLMGNILLQTH